MNGRIDGVVGGGVVGGFGVVLLVPNAVRLSELGSPVAAVVLAALGTVLSLVLVAAGVLLVRSGFEPTHVVRVAGWATLGTVVLGAVLGLVVAAGVDLPLFAAATLLSVSTFAHVLIGVRDVQRIRAEEVARQREKLAVLNRLVRHNLRHVAQVLIGAASMVPDATDRDDRVALAADVEGAADRLTEMNDVLQRSQSFAERGATPGAPVDLATVVADVVSEYRAAYPDATVEADVPGDCRVAGGDGIRDAVAELVENAIVHGGDPPAVELDAVVDRGRVSLHVSDTGPGIPEAELAVITRETDVTQLEHSQGLGLWFVRWVMDAADGEIRIDAGGPGTTVTLDLPRA